MRKNLCGIKFFEPFSVFFCFFLCSFVFLKARSVKPLHDKNLSQILAQCRLPAWNIIRCKDEIFHAGCVKCDAHRADFWGLFHPEKHEKRTLKHKNTKKSEKKGFFFSLLQINVVSLYKNKAIVLMKNGLMQHLNRPLNVGCNSSGGWWKRRRNDDGESNN